MPNDIGGDTMNFLAIAYIILMTACIGFTTLFMYDYLMGKLTGPKTAVLILIMVLAFILSAGQLAPLI